MLPRRTWPQITPSIMESPSVLRCFRLMASPAIEWEASTIDALGFAEANAAVGTIAGQTQINIVDASHPLAAGFPKGLVTVSGPETYSQSIPVGGHIVATPATPTAD